MKITIVNNFQKKTSKEISDELYVIAKKINKLDLQVEQIEKKEVFIDVNKVANTTKINFKNGILNISCSGEGSIDLNRTIFSNVPDEVELISGEKYFVNGKRITNNCVFNYKKKN